MNRASARCADELMLDDVDWRGFVEPVAFRLCWRAPTCSRSRHSSDTFGIVLLEAAATGLPLISSPHAGATRDLVERLGTGLVVEPRDTAALARALVALARDAGLRRRMGRAAHDVAARRTPARTAEAYLRAATSVALG